MSQRSWRRWSYLAAWSITSFLATAPAAHAQSSDVVLYASDVSRVQGNWSRVSAAGAAGGEQLASADRGWSTTNAPVASPADFFEMTFYAPSATTYKVWLRLRATGNSKWNDAVWVQFSDSNTTGGSAVYRIGTTSGLLVNLEPCKDCGVNGWGWQDKGYWLSQTSQIRFSGSGTHTIRVQTREDGVQVDQIVLSPATYASNAPGQHSGDATIVPKSPTSPPPGGGSLPATPNSPNVPSGTVGVTTTPTLSWKSSGATSYDLRLGTANPPPTYRANLTASYTSPSQLAAGTRFYWQVVAKNSAGSSTGPVWSFTTAGSAAAPPPPPPGTGGNFRMMTWNIHQGRTKSNVYDLVGQANFIASQHPDVVALQEVNTWDENQPQRLRTLLQNATGQTWTLVWAPVTNNAGTEGNVILTRLPVSATSTFQMHATSDWSITLANRSAARAAVTVGGVTFNVVATHLDYGNTSWRTIQLQQLMGWLPNFGGPRLVGGDFNSWWGESWITTMMSQSSDTWQDVTGSNQNGYTVNNAVRFDYIFRSFTGASRATPTNCFAPGTNWSDHNPVIADFHVQ